jgi:hypothetical protein
MRTLVKQVAGLGAPRTASSPANAGAVVLQPNAMAPTAAPDVAISPASGLPRLQLKGIQRAPASRDAADIAVPAGRVNLPGFIDTSDGANLRTGPAEAGGKTVIDAPLPPATRVFVSGMHPSAPEWCT